MCYCVTLLAMGFDMLTSRVELSCAFCVLYMFCFLGLPFFMSGVAFVMSGLVFGPFGLVFCISAT